MEDIEFYDSPCLVFYDEGVEQWYEEDGGGGSKKDFRLQLHGIVIRYELYNVFRDGFKVYNRPVKMNGDYEIVDRK